jgi:hypothetical protein
VCFCGEGCAVGAVVVEEGELCVFGLVVGLVLVAGLRRFLLAVLRLALALGREGFVAGL